MPAQGERHGRDRDQQAQFRRGDETDGEPAERRQRTEVEQVLARQHHRRRPHPGGELEERDDRSGERHSADEDTDEDLGVMDLEQ